ncbi:MAG: hypothetical protein QM778_36030 [Myxococcales bacterium]
MSTPGRDLTGRCGTCIFYMRLRVDESGTGFGECRLGCWPAPLKDTATCASHQAPGQAPKPRARERAARGPDRSEPNPLALRPAIPSEVGIDMDQEEFRNVLREILLDELGLRDIELGERWLGGEVVLVPGKQGTQEKRIPIDSLFRKIVLIREKLRVLEQKINNNDKLSDEDRLQMQQYVTQCYGSLTTFNVLFKNKGDYFTGQSGKDE